MASAMDATKHNTKAAYDMKQALRAMARAYLFIIVDEALKSVMLPNSSNYWGRDMVSGTKMVHGSSNAAWNWQVSINGSQKRFVNDKNRYPIGDHYDTRSSENDPAMYEVIDERKARDIGKNLYNALFSNLNKPIPKVSLYNPIPAGYYADNANVKAAESMLTSYAQHGGYKAQTWLNIGPVDMRSIMSTVKEIRYQRVRD